MHSEVSEKMHDAATFYAVQKKNSPSPHMFFHWFLMN